MRNNTRNYIVPKLTQGVPDDNTEKYVLAQVDVYRRGGIHVHPEIAEQIASLWQSAGYDGIELAQLASGHIGDPSDLLATVERTRKAADSADRPELVALRAYIRACTMTQWTATASLSGVQVSDSHAAYSADGAVSAVKLAAEELADDIGECSCETDGDDLCDPCTVGAIVGSIATDGDIKTDRREWGYIMHLGAGTASVKLTSRTATIGALTR